MASPDASARLGRIEFSPGGEEWIEYGPPDDRRRIGFHDYEALYDVPGLYERVFYDRLGMRSTTEVVKLYGETLRAEGLDPGGQAVLDLGAGSGIGAAKLRELGVGRVVGLDSEPAVADAARRDHPGTYDDYLVGDLAEPADGLVDRLAGHQLTAVLALAAIGVGHVPVAALERALSVLAAGGLFAFAVHPALLPGSEDPTARQTGYPQFLAGLLDRSEELGRLAYVHRRRADGTDDEAVAVIGRLAKS